MAQGKQQGDGKKDWSRIFSLNPAAPQDQWHKKNYPENATTTNYCFSKTLLAIFEVLEIFFFFLFANKVKPFFNWQNNILKNIILLGQCQVSHECTAALSWVFLILEKINTNTKQEEEEE